MALTKVKNVIDITADTMADLLSMQHKTGSVQLLGYHERGDGGGGVFFWDAAQDKAEHNGGTVIDPDVTYPTDWDNQTQLAAWFAGDNTGTGVWRRQYDGAVNVKWFGAKGDGVTDDTAALQACIINANILKKSVFLPSGNYPVQPNSLLKNTGVSSHCLKGEGRGNTTISLVSGDLDTDFLLENSGLWGFSQFEDINFFGKSGCTFALMQGGTPHHVQSISFTRCQFIGFTNLFKITGDTMASEFSFYNCRFYGFSGYGFEFNNPQAMNWRFYGCEAEVFSGSLFKLLAGNYLAWFQGSIIPEGSGASIVWTPSSANSNLFGAGNSPNVAFYSAKLEVRDSTKLLLKENAAVRQTCVFENCGMGGGNITSTAQYPIKITGAGKFIFNGCNAFNNYTIDYDNNGASSNRASFSFNECDTDFKELLQNSLFVLTASPSNHDALPVFKVSGSKYYNGTFQPESLSTKSISGQTIIPISFDVTKESLLYGGNTSRVAEIKPCYLKQINFTHIPNTAYGNQTFTINVKNGDSSITYGSFSWNPNSASSKQTIDLFTRIDITKNEFLTFEFSNTFGTAFYRGYLELVTT